LNKLEHISKVSKTITHSPGEILIQKSENTIYYYENTVLLKRVKIFALLNKNNKFSFFSGVRFKYFKGKKSHFFKKRDFFPLE